MPPELWKTFHSHLSLVFLTAGSVIFLSTFFSQYSLHLIYLILSNAAQIVNFNRNMYFSRTFLWQDLQAEPKFAGTLLSLTESVPESTVVSPALIILCVTFRYLFAEECKDRKAEHRKYWIHYIHHGSTTKVTAHSLFMIQYDSTLSSFHIIHFASQASSVQNIPVPINQLHTTQHIGYTAE